MFGDSLSNSNLLHTRIRRIPEEHSSLVHFNLCIFSELCTLSQRLIAQENKQIRHRHETSIARRAVIESKGWPEEAR